MVIASVVIPARDEAERLPRVLAACARAAAHVPGGVEVIVADHGSRDRTAAVARAAGARVVDAAGAPTIAAVRNRGAAVARGRVIAFVDADCVPCEGWLAAAVRLFREVPGCGAAGYPARVRDGAGWIARASESFSGCGAGPARSSARWLPSACLAVRRRAFDWVGGFDESLATCEDYDLTLRIAARGFSLVHDPALWAVHLREPATVGELFRKEVWRGRASLQGATRHGLVASEVPSLALPFVHALLPAVAVALLLGQAPALAAAVLALALLPSLAMALRVATDTGHWRLLPSLVAFALVYNAARVAALVPRARAVEVSS